MEQPQNFNLKQREMFAQLLAQAKERIQEELESDHPVDRRVEAELLPKLVKEHGASDLITKVRKLSKELGQAETALRQLGFSCDENRIEVHYDAPEALTKTLEAAKRSARQERNKVLRKYDKKYDLATLSVWASDDAQEARKAVEDLL